MDEIHNGGNGSDEDARVEAWLTELEERDRRVGGASCAFGSEMNDRHRLLLHVRRLTKERDGVKDFATRMAHEKSQATSHAAHVDNLNARLKLQAQREFFRVEAVRQLHHKRLDGYLMQEVCDQCSDEESRSWTLWPCPTIQAIDGEDSGRNGS